MRQKVRITDEQTAALLKEYSTRESVIELFYFGPVNTCINLETALKYGVTVNSLAYFPIVLPEYRKGTLPSHSMAAYLNQQKIVKSILANFIDNNPQYFRKVTQTKYAVSDKFILDILLHHKQRGFDPIDLSSIFLYLTDLNIFTKIAEIFYIPFRSDETLETLRRKYFSRNKPYKYRKRNPLFPPSGINPEANP